MKNLKYSLWRLLGKSHSSATELKSLEWEQFWFFVRDGVQFLLKKILK
jgi:hypothetical protein